MWSAQKIKSVKPVEVTIEALWLASYEHFDDAQVKLHLEEDKTIVGTDIVSIHVPVLNRLGAAATAVGISKSKKTLTRVTWETGSMEAAPDHGWWTPKGWVQTKDLDVGDRICLADGESKIVSLEPLEGPRYVYDLDVPGDRSYVANGAIVHNSHLVVQFAKNQAKLGYKVVVLPIEMSEREAYARLLANVAEVDSLKINLKRLEDAEKDFLWKRYRKFQRYVEKRNGRFTVYKPKSDVSIEEALAAVHALNPDVIYIDYIGLLKGADGDDQWRKLGQIARYGKVYAGNHNKVVVLAAQVGDDGKLRYSQAIKEHSSLAFSFVATKESRERGYLNMEMFKGRNQVLMNFTVKIDYQYSRVRDLDPKELESIETETTDPKKKRAGSAPNRKGKKDPEEMTMPDLDD